MNKQNKTYNATDFANYHAGKMPAAEMYALEKAALEDDFLADALEGYTFSGNAALEIEAIERNLSKKEAKVIPIAKAKNNWLRMVAAAAIVLGLGTLFYTINSKNKGENIAKVETSNAVQKDSIVPQSNNNGNSETAAEQKTDNSTGTKKANENVALVTPEIDLDVPKTIMPQSPIVYADLNTVPPSNTTNFNSIQNNGIFQYNIDSKTGGPKQLATNRNNNQSNNNNFNLDDKAKFKILARTDSTSFPIAMNDKVAEKEIAAAPEAAKPEAKLEEVVVTTGYGNNKRKDVSSANSTINTDVLNGKVAGLNVDKGRNNNELGKKVKAVSLNKSANGENVNSEKIINTSLQEFNNYLRKNIKPVFDDKGNEIKGTVKLSFKTNKAGQPTKIKVTQSLSKKADAQAIELLKNATNWPANYSDRTTVEIIF